MTREQMLRMMATRAALQRVEADADDEFFQHQLEGLLGEDGHVELLREVAEQIRMAALALGVHPSAALTFYVGGFVTGWLAAEDALKAATS